MEHFFRHEAGRIVSLLTRIFGLRNLQLAEDMVQDTLIAAHKEWSFGSMPENPSAWVMVVAKRKLLNHLRRESVRDRIVRSLDLPAFTEMDLEQSFRDSEIGDSMLRMIFACCHPEFPVESRIAMTLKILCGFGTREIAGALLVQESAIQKRITRAKQAFRDGGFTLEIPASPHLEARLQSVCLCIYLLFNEGYNSGADTLIRKDLCAEAMRLCGLVVEHFPEETGPRALLALMCLHAARFDSRIDDRGALVIFSKQNRSLWNTELIRRGVEHLEASQGETLTEYHLEAAIAATHCTAKDFASTDWGALDRYYAVLGKMKTNPVIELNRAIIQSYLEGPESAISRLEKLREHPRLREYHLLYATLGELNERLGRLEAARENFGKAIEWTASPTEKEFLKGKIAAI